MMDSNGVQRLWGHDFRVVGGGLDESDVSAFVEDLLNQLQASIQKSDRLESLYALAESTLSGAERLASETPGRDETEIAQRPPPAAAEAEHLADEIIERAREAASALEASGRLKAQQKVTEVAETLQAMQLWAHEEFTKLREYEERLDAFNTSFETFLALIGEGFPAEPTTEEERPAPQDEEADPSDTTPEPGPNIAEMPLLEDVKRASREAQGSFGDLPYSILDDEAFSSN